jgi:molybdopterin-guanine dinucleotide biosynthesis protein A
MSSGSSQRADRARLGAVLAGGSGTRIGRPKAGVELAGRPLVAYPVDVIAAAGLEPVVVAKRASDLPHLDSRIVHDIEQAVHPAAGILAALRVADGAPVVVLACDMPFVPPALVCHLAALDVPVAVPSIRGRLQPLLARYGPPAEAVLDAAVRRSESLQSAVGALDPMIIEGGELAEFGPPEGIAFNVNDARDLATAERMLAVAPR